MRTTIGGVDKFLMFRRWIDQKERMAIIIKFEDNDSANGLTEDWVEVERAC